MDTLAYVYTLTAEGTTHGFERGYDAFLGDPFGADVIADNLGISVVLAVVDVPEPGTFALLLLGLAGLVGRRVASGRAARPPPLRASPRQSWVGASENSTTSGCASSVASSALIASGRLVQMTARYSSRDGSPYSR